MCRWLKVSASGQFEWSKRPPSARQVDNVRLVARMRELHDDGRGTFGAGRMRKDLAKESETPSLNRVARLMAAVGMQGWPGRKRRGQRSGPGVTPPAEGNLLERDIVALQPETKWVMDITETKTQQGKFFLCIVMDLCDQHIAGWSMDDRQDRQMVIRAVEMAVGQRQGSQEVILHSDRGSQFRSCAYQQYQAANGLIYSVSAVGHCGVNAACKGFFGLIKSERIYRKSYPTLDAARADVFDYIERRHNPRMQRRIARQDQKIAALLEPPLISG